MFEINPISKPRMTQQDKWKQRKCTSAYWAFKDELKLKFNLFGLKELPSVISSVSFYIPMPDSWSDKKKREMNGRNHTQKPDLDNLLKGLMDAVCKHDEHISEITHGLKKCWATKGEIIIEI